MPSAPITHCFEEIDRCVNDLGFIGIMINPDPYEGTARPSPGMGDEYWYPLYEKMVELDVPALIHSADCKDPWDTYSNYFIATETAASSRWSPAGPSTSSRTSRSSSRHGGGAVPYQVGRYRAFFGRT